MTAFYKEVDGCLNDGEEGLLSYCLGRWWALTSNILYWSCSLPIILIAGGILGAFMPCP